MSKTRKQVFQFGVLGLAIGLAILFVHPLQAVAQVEISPKVTSAVPLTLEPGAGQEIDNADLSDLGDGVVVFEFDVTDVDPLANDGFPPSIDCFVVQNLGSATSADIADVALLHSKNGNDKVVSTQTASYQLQSEQIVDFDSGDFPYPKAYSDGHCPDTNGSDANWEAIFPTPLNTTAIQSPDEELPTVVPDYPLDPSVNPTESKTFKIAVRVADTNTLGSGAQNHSIRLRVLIQYREKVGSPERISTFTASVTDPVRDYVWNGGINGIEGLPDSGPPTEQVESSIRPGEQGVVAGFRVCDEDAQSRSLQINQLTIQQGPTNNAAAADIRNFSLRIQPPGVSNWTQQDSPSVDQFPFDWNPSSPIKQFQRDGQDGDPYCVKFLLEAEIANSAMRGRKIQPEIFFTGVSEGSSIDPQVSPSYRPNQSVIIGSGILRIPDVGLPLRRSPDGSLQRQQTASLSLQVDSLQEPLSSQTGSVQFDPNLIRVVDFRVNDAHQIEINGTQTPTYQLNSSTISNRTGMLTYSIGLTDAARQQTESVSLNTGSIARILVQPTSQAAAGQRSLLSLSVDGVRDVNDDDVTQSLLIHSGSITWETSGDIDGDGMATVRDALLLANAIINDCEDLNDDQRIAADVDGTAPLDEVPTCDDLTSSDVSKIAELALDATGLESSQVPSHQSTAAPDVTGWSWLDGLKRLLGWDTDAPQQPTELKMVPSDRGYTMQASTTDAIGGLQGRIRYDPDALRVEEVKGLNEYEIAASRVNERRGEIRFVALAPAGDGSRSEQVLEVVTSGASDRAVGPRMSVDMLVDPQGEPLGHRVAAASSTRGLRVQTLSLSQPETGRWALNVKGQGIQRVEVQGFDLGGQRRFASSAQGSSLEWRALDAETGRRLANGVYLYRVTVEGVNGEVWRSDVRRLVVLR